ncbi:MAG: UDP-N-acetylmuramate--L-alanine ligase [Candidatus Komeilibacteria bacterium]
MNRILMAGGGTLGSVSPLVAVAQQFPEADYLFITTKKGPEVHFLRQRNFRTVSISAGKWRRYFSWRNITDIIKTVSGWFQSLIIIGRYQPDIIVAAGGFVAVPVVWAGWILGKKIIVHQQDLELGLANRLMAPAATIVTIAFSELAHFFPGKQVIHTGNPARRIAASNHAVLQSGLTILGGSQGARGLNDFVSGLLPQWTKNWPVNHILGATNLGQRSGVVKNYQAYGFVDQELPDLLLSARLVITRAGIATMTELASLSKPVIVVPIPGSHQEANANFFASHNAAIVVQQGDSTGLQQAVDSLMTDPVLAATLGRNLNRLLNPNSARDYVQVIKENIRLEVEVHPVVYLAGIGGIGLSALAEYFRLRDYTIFGSDLNSSTITRRLEQRGAKIFSQQKRGNLPDNCSLFIYSAALPGNSEEILEAKRRHIPTYTYNRYLGLISRTKKTIAISGTHGKTTTTGLIGFMLTAAQLDPTVIVGGLIPQFDGNFRNGQSDYLVVEACEYRSHMLQLAPWIIALTNIEEDHLDYFRDLAHIQEQFQKFVDTLPANGLLIRNLDDKNSKQIIADKKQITVAIDSTADYQAKNILVGDQQQKFVLLEYGQEIGEMVIRIPGKFNIYNSLVAIAVARSLNISYDIIKKCLWDYRGSWRRFEKIGIFRGLPVYSDYAHHPTEITNTIEAAKKFYPEKKVLAIFQPHSYSRTESLFDSFSRAFAAADKIIILQTFKVAGREDDVEETDIARKLAKEIGAKARYAADFAQARTLLGQICQPADIIIFMGAGDIDSLARSIIEHG